MQLLLIQMGGIDLFKILERFLNNENKICLKALVGTTISFSLLPKLTPTLFKLADIFELVNERKDLDEFSVPAESRLQPSLRRLALASTLVPIIGICPLINRIKRS
jgi:hypothetical protein